VTARVPLPTRVTSLRGARFCLVGLDFMINEDRERYVRATQGSCEYERKRDATYTSHKNRNITSLVVYSVPSDDRQSGGNKPPKDKHSQNKRKGTSIHTTVS
jgi:hypothetical protein